MLAAYAALIELWQPAVNRFPDQEAGNIARAERYLLHLGPPDTVIVGSSLGVRLREAWLPSNVYNLSLGGLSGRTGLAIVKGSGAFPRRLLIETNTLQRAPNARFLRHLPSAMQLAIGRHVRALRYEFRPINLLLSHAMGWDEPVARSANLQDDCVRARNVQAERERENPTAMARLKQLGRERSERFTDASLHKAVDALAGELQPLRSAGVQIAFFEMPVHPLVAKAQNYNAVREAIRTRLPDLAVLQLDGAGLHTADGSHLELLSAIVATCELSETFAAIDRRVPSRVHAKK